MQYVVAAVGEESRGFNGIIRLNHTGAFIFESLQNGRSKDEILEELTSKYDVDKQKASEDLDKMMDTLQTAGILKDEL